MTSKGRIRLEGRFLNAPAESLTLDVALVSYHEPRFSKLPGTDGSVQQTQIASASLFVTGLPPDFDPDRPWTHIFSPDLPAGEAEIQHVSSDGPGRARFDVRTPRA